MKRRKSIEARFYRSLSVTEIEEVAAFFKEDLQQQANRYVRRHDSTGALAAIEAQDYVTKFVTTLKLRAGSQLHKLSRPARARDIHIREDLTKKKGGGR